MRDVSGKPNTLRIAKASAVLHCLPSTVQAVRSGDVPKADPLVAARVAGIQAAKNTALLIPDCHPIPLDFVDVGFELKDASIHVYTTVKALWKTGVEMEAMSAAAAAALTLYDMLKPIDSTMEIDSMRLDEKRGGKSDLRTDAAAFRAGVLVISDSVAAGKREDTSGRMAKERLEAYGLAVVEYKVLPDDTDAIEAELLRLADVAALDLVVTTGGTGIGPRDLTPEATRRVVQRELPGVMELARSYGQERVRTAMLSRAVAGVRGRTIILNLPGSPSGVSESFEVLFPWLFHAFDMLKGAGH